eukprot:GHVU01180880.1.p3 GENE.GHVU01180880.1~~GHVU01180880.1.p3  ORF type:complete len:119 (-),score=27.63 GHVU01180880.1:149-505(-)
MSRARCLGYVHQGRVRQAQATDDDDAEETELEGMWAALELYRAEELDRSDAAVTRPVVTADGSRPPFPDYNDKDFPQDDIRTTFRGVKVPLSQLVPAEVWPEKPFAEFDEFDVTAVNE